MSRTGSGTVRKNVVRTVGGSARSFHIDSMSITNIAPILRENIRRESQLITDEALHHREVGREFGGGHDAVMHGNKEYVRYGGDITITTNTVEGFYSIFKRGMKGVYQHCAEKRLHRYLAEFDFRYNTRISLGWNDSMRANKAIQGKRLM